MRLMHVQYSKSGTRSPDGRLHLEMGPFAISRLVSEAQLLINMSSWNHPFISRNLPSRGRWAKDRAQGPGAHHVLVIPGQAG